jgi:hypothetical protein
VQDNAGPSAQRPHPRESARPCSLNQIPQLNRKERKDRRERRTRKIAFKFDSPAR